MSIIEAEYTVVQERTLPVIIAEIKTIDNHVSKVAMEGAIKIGMRLQEAKEKVGHGNFEEWCKENLNYTSRTARNFMRIATEYGGENGLISNRKMSSDLSISNALSLLKVPEEDREKFVENHEIGDMTNKELEEEIRQLKAEKLQAKTKEKELQEQIDRAGREAESLRSKIIQMETKIVETENQPAEVDSELVDKLEAEAEALKEALAKAESDLIVSKGALKREKGKVKAAEANKEKEIQEAISEKEQEIRDAAKAEAEEQSKELQMAKDQLEADNKVLRSKLEKAGNDSIIKFKILTDQLQDVFDQCGNCILDEEDPDRAEKMNKAMKMIVEKFLADL